MWAPILGSLSPVILATNEAGEREERQSVFRLRVRGRAETDNPLKSDFTRMTNGMSLFACNEWRACEGGGNDYRISQSDLTC